jgi:hypothetical protein
VEGSQDWGKCKGEVVHDLPFENQLNYSGEHEMKRQLICGLMALALLSVIVNATVKAVPMKGSGVGQITAAVPGPDGVAISAVGDGEATHLGKFTREESLLLNPVAGTITGSVTFTAADGSVLYCDLSGGYTGENTLAGTYTITGGEGRFEDATGTANFSVTQGEGGSFTFGFIGTIELN